MKRVSILISGLSIIIMYKLRSFYGITLKPSRDVRAKYFKEIWFNDILTQSNLY